IVFARWLPEVLASFLSLGTFLSTIALLGKYQNRPMSALDLPYGLTLNGMLSVLATLNRACLLVPVGSAIMQELWIYYSAEKDISRLNGLHSTTRFDAASRGPWG
ncbi:hypothetical protein EJ03DRAFT_253140, partial [Teratosphaeria nubilosa]